MATWNYNKTKKLLVKLKFHKFSLAHPIMFFLEGIMKSKVIRTFLKDNFIVFTCTIAFIESLLYCYKGIQKEFDVGTIIYIIVNTVYIPFGLVFRKKCFAHFYLFYAVILVFVIAFEKTLLFNNYTALFIICLVIMIQPKITKPAIVVYFVSVIFAFLINEEPLYLFFIHFFRSIWFLGIVIYVLDNKFERKKLILYDDEAEILSQICDGKTYQKEVRGYSENTVYRKLKAARERNGNISKEQLIELYKQEFQNNEKSASTLSPDITAKSNSLEKS